MSGVTDFNKYLTILSKKFLPDEWARMRAKIIQMMS